MSLTKESLLLRCCHLFYSENMSIQEIADYLDISRFRVGRYIKEAQELGIVKVQFHDPNIEYEQLALRLEKSLPIQRAIVAPTPYNGDIHAIRISVGHAGAELLHDIHPDMTLAITWGRTVAHMVDALPSNSLSAKRVVELAGGIGQISAEVPARAVALKSAERLKAECVQMPAPIIADSMEAAQILLRESSISRTLDLASQADIAVMGVGAADLTSMLYHSSYLSKEDLAYLSREGAVGSIFGRFFDVNGIECDEEYKGRAVALSLDAFLEIPERIVLASGVYKTQSILGIAGGQLATTLVTDSETAITVLDTITESGEAARATEIEDSP